MGRGRRELLRTQPRRAKRLAVGRYAPRAAAPAPRPRPHGDAITLRLTRGLTGHRVVYLVQRRQQTRALVRNEATSLEAGLVLVKAPVRVGARQADIDQRLAELVVVV